MRLIDVDAAIAISKSDKYKWNYDLVTIEEFFEKYLKSFLDVVPTIDPSSLVKRGRWVPLSDTSCQCSNCEHEISFVDKGEPPTVCGFNYCHMCGAEMEDA